MLISGVFPNGRSLMFVNALIQVSGCVADIIRIALITLEMVYNALLVHKRGFAFFWLDVRSHLSACVHGMDIFFDFPTYVGCTCPHLYQRIEEHKGSAIEKHVRDQRWRDPSGASLRFKILRKCQSKFDCLIYEMLCIKEVKPTMNTQSDSFVKKKNVN